MYNTIVISTLMENFFITSKEHGKTNENNFFTIFSKIHTDEIET